MARGKPDYEAVERGIQKITRAYPDGRVVIKYRIKYANQRGIVEYRTIDSHRIKDARDALAEARAAVKNKRHVAIQDGRVRFLDVASQWLDVKEPDWKPRTYHSCRWTVESKLAPLHDIRMNDLTYDRVSKFRAKLKRPNKRGDRPAPSSIKRTMWVLHAICEHARKRRLIIENPCADLDKDKGGKPVLKMPSTEDVERLITHLARPLPERQDSKGRTLKTRPADPRYALLVETAAYTGLRAGELAGLQVRDLNFFNRSISVSRTVIALPGEGLLLDTPKSEAGTRTVPGLDVELLARLRAHCANLSPRDYVFGSRDTDGNARPLHHGNFYRRIVRPAAEQLGITMTFHGLRHHYASLLIDLGLSPVEVAAQLGHESAAFTLRTYAHLFHRESTDMGDAIGQRRAAARGQDGTVTALRPRKAPF